LGFDYPQPPSKFFNVIEQLEGYCYSSKINLQVLLQSDSNPGTAEILRRKSPEFSSRALDLEYALVDHFYNRVYR
jgi:hypothetical protein